MLHDKDKMMAKTYLTAGTSHGKEVTAANPTYAHIRGWDAGVRVEANRDGTEFRVYATGGSSGSGNIYLGLVKVSDNGVVFLPHE